MPVCHVLYSVHNQAVCYNCVDTDMVAAAWHLGTLHRHDMHCAPCLRHGVSREGGEFGMEEGSGQGRKRKGEERKKGRGLAGRRRRYGK